MEQVKLLEAHGEDYRLKATFKTTALRMIMNIKKEAFENMEEAV